MMKHGSALLHAAMALLLILPVPAKATEAGWALLRQGGQVVLINEAYSLATGRHTGDDIDNCRTQQTLSDRGRQQAGRMGALFYARSAPVELVLTSRHCRAQETASIAFRDSKIEVFEPLNELSSEEEPKATQIEDTITRIDEYGGSGNLIMVTHPANIAALTGVTPRPGEAVVISPTNDGLSIAARITFN